MPSHKDLPDSELHEPKGVASAALGQVYVADGAGSGDWKVAPYTYALNTHLTDISTASSAYVCVPKAGTIKSIRLVINNAINTATSTVSFFIGATQIATSDITVDYSGSAAGDSYLSVPTGDNQVLAGDVIRCTSDGGSSGAASAEVTYEVSVE